jgi:maltooligosyltrehalose trehalohydrolase
MTTLQVWAPSAGRVELVSGDERRDMTRAEDGWWRLPAPELTAGDDYAFSVDGSEPLPDPRSARQPHGVFGASRIVDHSSFPWTDAAWRGVPLPGRVIYELHVGTFTREGTFDAAAARLRHLVDLGVDVVELLPVAAFDGDRGWGYDGVALFAVHEAYGGPEGLKRFVDAAHQAGLAVCLDVVYNHLGPAGNVLDRFGPYFTDRYVTPWGDAVNLDGPGSDEVRRFLGDNALGWLRDYHIDGLRLDAVQALADNRALSFLEELSAQVEELRDRLGREVFVIAESDRNDVRTVLDRDAGGLGLTAQWDDDVHHAVHALLTGERHGYYVDFGSFQALATTLTGAFLHDGRYSTFRGRRHGRPVDRDRVSGHRFVAYTQSHDQVGNRAGGERLAALLSPGRLRIAAALIATSAFTPMLFMGEEWGAATPWQFFTSFTEEQVAARVRDGRRAEFADHGWPDAGIPDPQDPATYHRSVLDWAEAGKEEHADLLEWYRRLLALRRQQPGLASGALDRVRCRFDESAGWFTCRRDDVLVVVNLSDHRQQVPVDGAPVDVLLASTPGFVFAEGTVEIDAESVAIATLAGEPQRG